MNTFSCVNTMVFDKTGKLTNGKPSASFAKAYGNQARDYLRFAAAIESESDHPLGRAIVDYVEDKAKTAEFKVTETTVEKGKGMVATADGVQLAIGNKALMQEQSISLPLS